MSDSDPICVCGVARSEHQLCGCPDGFEPRQHPDVVLAIQHREERQRRESARERSSESDLKKALQELTGIVLEMARQNRRGARVTEAGRVQVIERAKKLEALLS